LPLHIVQRGHNRDACFFCDDDYQRYLHWLAQALVKEGVQLHAYVLMTNHVHLLLTPVNAASVARVLISIGRRYVQYINRTYRRTGTLWDSRYKASLVDVDGYLLACMRYIELNPVRAAMVKDPAHYRWSSYRNNALGQADPIVSPHATYSAIATEDRMRRNAYRGLFQSALEEQAVSDIRFALNQNVPLGNERFVSTIERMTGQRCDVRPRGRPRKSGAALTVSCGGDDDLFD